MLKSDDLRIAGPAAKILINLDEDDSHEGKYKRRVYLLQPIHRGFAKSNVDVILVHGLLGGVFFTWRQRDFKVNNKNLPSEEKKANNSKLTSSDPSTREYLKELEKLQKEEWDDLGSDFEFVLSDLPRSIDSDGPFIISGYGLSLTNRRVYL